MEINIKLILRKSLILESVKGETYIKGRVDNSAAQDGKAHLLAYEEEAGNEEFHERKLQRTMFSALAELKGILADYVHPINSTTGDNVVIETDDDNINIVLKVSDRFNQAQTDPLAHLCSKFIEDNMLTQWWGTFNQNQAQFYAQQQLLDRNAISICFNKQAPAVPKNKYSEKLVVDTSETTAEVGDSFTLNYTIDGEAVDDIECMSDNPYVASVVRLPNPLSFLIKCHHRGVTTLRLFSRHNDSLTKEKTLIVTADR